jgi:hypothetical protein
MIARHPLPSRKLIDVILDSKAETGVEWDPLVPLYVDSLLKMKALKIPDVLTSLLVHSMVRPRNSGEQPYPRPRDQASILLTEYRIIQNLVAAATAGFAPETAGGMLNSFIAIADWILALLAFNPGAKAVDGSGEPDNEAPQHPEWLMGSADALAVFESLGILFAALAATAKGLNALAEMKNQGGITIWFRYNICAKLLLTLFLTRPGSAGQSRSSPSWLCSIVCRDFYPTSEQIGLSTKGIRALYRRRQIVRGDDDEWCRRRVHVGI